MKTHTQCSTSKQTCHASRHLNNKAMSTSSMEKQMANEVQLWNRKNSDLMTLTFNLSYELHNDHVGKVLSNFIHKCSRYFVNTSFWGHLLLINWPRPSASNNHLREHCIWQTLVVLQIRSLHSILTILPERNHLQVISSLEKWPCYRISQS